MKLHFSGSFGGFCIRVVPLPDFGLVNSRSLYKKRTCSEVLKGPRTAMVFEGKREEVAEGWRKLQMESLVSCSFNPRSIREKIRLVVDDKCVYNCSRGKHEEKKQLRRRSSIGC